MIDLSTITKESLAFDWKGSTFEAFLERIRTLIKSKNRFGFCTKSQYWTHLGITDFKNWKVNLINSKDGDLKLLLLLCLFSDEEQHLVDLLSDEDTILKDSVRISIDKILNTQFNKIYEAESVEVSDNNILDTFKDRFTLTITKSDRLN